MWYRTIIYNSRNYMVSLDRMMKKGKFDIYNSRNYMVSLD